jgi:hypothetical protein
VPCELHTCFAYDRGGKTRITQIGPLTSIDWERVGDDISMANMRLSGSACDVDLQDLEPGRHEIVIFRGSQRVWEGPLTYLSFAGDVVEIQARDVMHYAYRTAMRRGYNNAYPNTTTCIKRSVTILRTEFNRAWERIDPPINVLPYLTAIERTGDSKTSRKTTRYQSSVFDDIDSMARTSGMDYTVVGRRIILHDTDTALGRTPVLSELDIAGDVKVTAYGMETAAFAAVTGGDGQVGTAEGINGFPDPYYGAWEIIDDAYDETEGTDQPTQSELESQAARNVNARIPTPVELRISDGSSLANTSALYDVDLLVPGVQVPVIATFTQRRLSQMQKLRRVRWYEDENGERCEITLLPTNSVIDEDTEG